MKDKKRLVTDEQVQHMLTLLSLIVVKYISQPSPTIERSHKTIKWVNKARWEGKMPLKHLIGDGAHRM